MAISEAARRDHDELFPGRVSTLAQTDPELIEGSEHRAHRHARDGRLSGGLAASSASEPVK